MGLLAKFSPIIPYYPYWPYWPLKRPIRGRRHGRSPIIRGLQPSLLNKIECAAPADTCEYLRLRVSSKLQLQPMGPKGNRLGGLPNDGRLHTMMWRKDVCFFAYDVQLQTMMLLVFLVESTVLLEEAIFSRISSTKPCFRSSVLLVDSWFLM